MTLYQMRQESLERYIEHTTENVFLDVEEGRQKAHRKHGENSIEAISATDFGKWLAILGEEHGEVCRALTYDQSTTMGELMDKLRAELIDVTTVATAWVAAIDTWMEPNGEDVTA